MKKLFVLSTFFFLALFSLQAQNLAMNTNVPISQHINLTDNTSEVATAEAIAFFKEKQKAIHTVLEQMDYPAVARENGVEGIVTLELTFNGTITDIKVRNSVGYGCDEAAIAAVKQFSATYLSEPCCANTAPVKVLVPFKFFLQ